MGTNAQRHEEAHAGLRQRQNALLLQVVEASNGGSSSRGIGGGWNRFGPAMLEGEARLLHTGSVRIRFPSISISTVECPIQVMRKPSGGPGSKSDFPSFTTGISLWGLRTSLPFTQRKPMSAVRRKLGVISVSIVFMNFFPSKCGDFFIRSSLAPAGLAPKFESPSVVT